MNCVGIAREKIRDPLKNGRLRLAHRSGKGNYKKLEWVAKTLDGGIAHVGHSEPWKPQDIRKDMPRER